MKQSGQIETEEQNSVIKPGNIIRLMQPFRPERYSYQEYTWAVVAGVVRDNLRSRQPSDRYKQIAQGQKLRLGEVLVYLCKPQSSTIYLIYETFDLNCAKNYCADAFACNQDYCGGKPSRCQRGEMRW